MFTSRTRRTLSVVLVLGSLLGVLLACTLPLPGVQPAAAPTGAAPAGETPAGGASGIPGSILTEVAATLYAQMAAPPAAPQASEAPGAEQPPTPAPTKPQPAAPPPPTSTATQSSQEAAPTRPAPPTETISAPAQPTQTTAPILFTPAPTSAVVVQPGAGFKVEGVNVPICGTIPSAIYRVTNLGTQPLESLSLFIQDVTSGQALFGPAVGNKPFDSSDRVCGPGGIESLGPGQTLFLGNTLGNSGLKGHTIRSVITLCTGPGATGACYQSVVDFVMP